MTKFHQQQQQKQQQQQVCTKAMIFTIRKLQNYFYIFMNEKNQKPKKMLTMEAREALSLKVRKVSN